MQQPPSPSCRRPRLGALGLGLFLLLLTGGARARASCDDCPEPTTEQLTEAGLQLQDRFTYPFMASRVRDYVLVNGEACEMTLEGDPVIEQLDAYWVLRARGEVWNCPESRSSDKVVMEVREGESTQWSITASGGFQLDAVVAAIEAKIDTGKTRGVAITEVRRVEKTLEAGHCRRVPYDGLFEVGRFRLTAQVHVTRTWAWWTKNDQTGDAVHQSGHVTTDCGTVQVVMTRRAAIGYRFDLSQKRCDHADCKSVVIDRDHIGIYGGASAPHEAGDAEAPSAEGDEPVPAAGDDEPVPASEAEGGEPVPASGDDGGEPVPASDDEPVAAETP